MPPSTTALVSDRAAARPASSFALHAQLDLVERHVGSKALSCLTGWMAVEKGREIVGLGLRLKPDLVVRCNYPFFRGDVPEAGLIGGSEALTGFNVLLPVHFEFAPEKLEFVALIAPDDGESCAFAVTLNRDTGRTQRLTLHTAAALPEIPEFMILSGADVSAVLERRLEDDLARRPQLTLRLDLINKCNLRCVMCYYSDEKISKRPAQRVSPEQFASWFEPLAPLTRDVVLSCGDEPLMSPHFEAIIRWLAAKAPEARIIFCTNGMLLSAKNAEAIIASRVYLMLFSFDGVTSETLHRIRVGSDYGKIIKNILGLKKLRAATGGPRPRFVFNYVMMESNIHEAAAFVRMAKRLGGDYVDLRHVVPMLDPRDIAHEMLENHKPKFNHYRECILAAAAECGMEIYIPPAFDIAASHDPASDPVCSLDEFHTLLRDLGEDPVVDPDPPRVAEIAAPARRHEAAHTFCERPFSEVMIQQQRDVYPCPWHQEKMGTLDGTTTLDEIFFGENFRRVRLAMLDPLGAPGCSNCPIKSGKLPTRIL